MDKELKGIKNLEGLSTKLIPHHGSGASVMCDGMWFPVNSCCYPETSGSDWNAVVEKSANSDKNHCLECLL